MRFACKFFTLSPPHLMSAFSAFCPVSLNRDCVSTLHIKTFYGRMRVEEKKNVPLSLSRSRNFQQIILFFCKLLFQIILCTSDGHLANILFMSGVAASDNSNTVDVVSKVAIICILTCHHSVFSVSLPRSVFSMSLLFFRFKSSLMAGIF